MKFFVDIADANEIRELAVTEAALAGANVATVLPSVLKQTVNHPLTKKGLAQFLANWVETGQTVCNE